MAEYRDFSDMRYFQFDASGQILLKYAGPGGDMVIPVSVRGIKEEAFAGCAALHSIVIPESVKYIGGGAFSDCTNPRQVSLPKDIVFVGRNSDCL